MAALINLMKARLSLRPGCTAFPFRPSFLRLKGVRGKKSTDGEEDKASRRASEPVIPVMVAEAEGKTEGVEKNDKGRMEG